MHDINDMVVKLVCMVLICTSFDGILPLFVSFDDMWYKRAFPSQIGYFFFSSSSQFSILIFRIVLHVMAATAATKLSSAGGMLPMLTESHPQLKVYALYNLIIFLDQFWPEMSTTTILLFM